MATDDDNTGGPAAPDPTDRHDKTVRELIDAATRAELERWFGLPSFEQLERQPQVAPAEDPDVIATRERREKAIAAVDPAMLEAHRRRTDPREDLLKFKPLIDVHVDPSIALLDTSMIDRQASIAEPREVELPPEMQDDLQECTPQALLRDLHRPELDFEKQFEIVDMAADQRVDVVAIVAEVMGTRYQVDARLVSPYHEGRALIDELRVSRRAPWTRESLAALPNRRVTE